MKHATYFLATVFIATSLVAQTPTPTAAPTATPSPSPTATPVPQITMATPATTGTMSVNMSAGVITITPTGACTFNTSTVGSPGQETLFVVTTSGTTSRILTFGTNFKTIGTLATGTVTAKKFGINFKCVDGTLWVETSRTTAM